LAAAIARLCGASVAVVGLENDRTRLEVARQYDCEVIVGDATDWANEVDSLGADGVVDATGVSVALDNALDLVRPAGWISKVGWGPQPINFSIDRLVQKNVKLQGSFSHNWPIWERIIRLMATGELDVRPITGGVWPLSKWKEAFETMHSGKIVKAVLKPEI
jgi:alcohol dehydrogenase/L-iditol 2-dehydrogenase